MIKDVKIKKWCIQCKNCENICPNIFKVQKGSSTIIWWDYKEHLQKILQAESMCPVKVINVNKEWNVNFDLKSAKLEEKIFLTEDTVELTFSVKEFSFKPWQYVSVQMKDRGWIFTRSYSIVSATENSFMLCVKLLKEGRWGNLLKDIKIWDSVKYLWGFGEFYLQDNNKSKVLIATGTWIAPMIAILEKLWDEVPKTVIFWLRYEEDIFYKEKLENYPNTKVIIVVSRPTDSFSWNKWRVNDYLSNINIDDDVYICGNPNMVDSVREHLINKWIKEENINNESFVATFESNNWIFKNFFFNWNFPYTWILEKLILTFAFLVPLIIIYFKSFQFTLWDISWWSLFLLMIIRPLADIFPKLLIFRKLVELRKALWILSAMIIVSRLWIWAYWYWIDYFSLYFSVKSFLISNNSIFARIGEITALILLVTSNNFSQNILWKWWKRIQRLSYLYFISGWIYIYQFWEAKIIISFSIVWILWLLARFWVKLWK